MSQCLHLCFGVRLTFFSLETLRSITFFLNQFNSYSSFCVHNGNRRPNLRLIVSFWKYTQRLLFHFSELMIFVISCFFSVFQQISSNWIRIFFFCIFFWEKLKKYFKFFFLKYIYWARFEPGTSQSIVLCSTNYSTVPMLWKWYFPGFLIR